MRTPDPSIPTPVGRPGRRAYAALGGAIVACAFLALASVGLDRQGLDYDEVHQAPAAFFYVGGQPAMFAHSFQGVPILNMRYSGAIKSTLYGLYLRFGGGRFTVASWRLLGLGLVAAGVFAFGWTAAAWLPMSSAVLFGALFLTDASVLLMARHDWGPIALSLALRLAFLSAWVALHRNPTPARCVVAGVMLGVALFEKLSAVVLMVPFVILLWELRTSLPRVWKAAGAGLALGALPLLLVNLGTLLLGSGLISLADVDAGRAFSQGSPFAFFSDYLSLGQGVGARFHVLGATNPSLPRAEALLVLVLLAIVGAAWRHGDARWMKLAASCA